MTSTNTNSPLYEIKRILKILRWIGGFPIKPLDSSFSQFIFIPWLEYIRFCFLILVFVMEYIYLMIKVLIYGGNLYNVYTFYETNYNKFSASKIDQFSTIFFNHITTISFSAVFIFVFKSNASSIGELCTDTKELRSMLKPMLIKNSKEKRSASHCFQMKKYAKGIVYGQCLNIVSSILWGIWAAIFLQTHYERTAKYGNDIKISYPIILTFQNTFILFGPMACTAEVVVGQIVESITDLFCRWEDILECSSNGCTENMPYKRQTNKSRDSIMGLKQTKSPNESDSDSHPSNSEIFQNNEIIEIGLKLEKIIVTTNRATEGLIATIFASHIVCLVFVCYHVISSLGLNDAITERLRMWQTMAGSFTAAMYLIRHYTLMNAGQILSVKIIQARRTFENYVFLKEYKGANDESSSKSYLLQKRLEMYQYAAPISPYAVFSLNNKTFCATVATIITYIVILIKLRGVENLKTPQ